MKLFNIFKKKKKIVKKEEEKKVEVRPLPKKKKVSGEAWRILKSPHITEKATELESQNKYVFKVFPTANKIEIKKAVEGLYGVDVVNVRIINIAGRQRRLGRQRGWKEGYKKAIVKIEKGQKIEIMPR